MVFNTFIKRQKALRGEAPDVFVYDDIPQALRVQVGHIWSRCFGSEKSSLYQPPNPAYKHLHKWLAEEFGMFQFPEWNKGHQQALTRFFVNVATTDQTLDMIDVSFRYALEEYQAGGGFYGYDPSINAVEAVRQLNARFKEHAVGYEFIIGPKAELVRKDNEHLHKEVVIPALHLLWEQGFEGANAEYRAAHEHYRHGRQKECLNECLKAFESTMKTICSRRKWAYKSTDTAKTLIETCLNNGLLPTFMQSHLGTVRSALESAIPTVRNKLGGHGQGEQVNEVPPFYAEYLLHETAATIVFLVDAFKALG